MPYLITFEDHVDYLLDVADFSAQLSAKWSSIKFEILESDNNLYALCWWIEEGTMTHEGGLHRNCRTIDIDDYSEGILQFAVWFRGIVPIQYRLMLAHDSSSNDLELTNNLTVSDIEKL